MIELTQSFTKTTNTMENKRNKPSRNWLNACKKKFFWVTEATSELYKERSYRMYIANALWRINSPITREHYTWSDAMCDAWEICEEWVLDIACFVDEYQSDFPKCTTQEAWQVAVECNGDYDKISHPDCEPDYDWREYKGLE